MKTRKNNPFLRNAVLTIAGIFLTASSQALTYYWDNNGSNAGYGTASGTWAAPTTGNASQGWSQNNAGTVLPVNVTVATADAVNFGNGATGLAAGTITVSTVNSGNITFASGSGAINLSGGSIALSATQTTTVNNASNTIGSNLTGAATSLTKAGTGTLYLSGSNTLNGNIAVTSGVLVQNSANALGGTNGVTISGNGILGLTSYFTRLQGNSGTQ